MKGQEESLDVTLGTCDTIGGRPAGAEGQGSPTVSSRSPGPGRQRHPLNVGPGPLTGTEPPRHDPQGWGCPGQESSLLLSGGSRRGCLSPCDLTLGAGGGRVWIGASGS